MGYSPWGGKEWTKQLTFSLSYIIDTMYKIYESESISHSFMSDSATPWTVAQKAPLSMGFPRQEYSSGLPFLSPGDLPNSRIKPASPALAGGFFTPEPSRKMHRKPRSSADFSGVK